MEVCCRKEAIRCLIVKLSMSREIRVTTMGQDVARAEEGPPRQVRWLPCREVVIFYVRQSPVCSWCTWTVGSKAMVSISIFLSCGVVNDIPKISGLIYLNKTLFIYKTFKHLNMRLANSQKSNPRRNIIVPASRWVYKQDSGRYLSQQDLSEFPSIPPPKKKKQTLIILLI